MKDQYFGDINDYRKYGLLRGLTGSSGLRLGVCWMLTPPDGRTDGRFLSYLNQPERFRHHDPELFDWLVRVVHVEGDRRTARLAESPLLTAPPHSVTAFHPATLPDSARGREAYFAHGAALLAGCDLVFFDPDNGLATPSTPPGRKNSCKYLCRGEAAAMYAAGEGASILIYQHFIREERASFTRRLVGALREATGAHSMFTFATANVLFLLAAQERHAPHFRERVERIRADWAPQIVPTEHDAVLVH